MDRWEKGGESEREEGEGRGRREGLQLSSRKIILICPPSVIFTFVNSENKIYKSKLRFYCILAIVGGDFRLFSPLGINYIFSYKSFYERASCLLVLLISYTLTA